MSGPDFMAASHVHTHNVFNGSNENMGEDASVALLEHLSESEPFTQMTTYFHFNDLPTEIFLW